MKKLISPLVAALALISTNVSAELTERITITKPDTITTNIGELDAFGVPLHSTEQSLKRMDFDTITAQANSGNATAQFYLGKMYHMGIHTDTDLELAKSWYQKSADNGNGNAMNNLASLLIETATDKSDTSSDLQKAIVLLEQAAAKDIPHAMTNLAQHYYAEFEKDPTNTQAYDKSMELLNQAAEMGFAPAYLYLHIAYGSDKPDSENNEHIIAKRLEYLTKAAEMGFAPAQLALSDYYQMNGVMSIDKTDRPLGIVQSYVWAKRACTNGMERGCGAAKYFGGFATFELEPYELACNESKKSTKTTASDELSKCQEYEMMKSIKSAIQAAEAAR